MSGSRVTFRIYSLCERSLTLLLDASAGRPGIVEDAVIAEADHLFIDSADIPKYVAYLSEISRNYNATGHLDIVTMQERSKIIMREIFEQPLDDKNASAVDELVDEIVYSILSRDTVLLELLIIKRANYNVYMHSVNVAFLAIAIGKEMGLKEDDLQYLGVGALLHDIGKLALPKEILQRRGRLTNTEYILYRSHITEGVKLLKSHWELPALVMVMIAQHHEKLCGRGYPLGIKGDQLGLYSRILGIVNSFDNLITPQPTVYAQSPFSAMDRIVKEKDSWDKNVLATFIEMLGNIESHATVIDGIRHFEQNKRAHTGLMKHEIAPGST